ncbi:Nucleic acid-binding, OB-fold,Replication factor A protein 3 [Cinara cedri]|uniref:Nucleic acid-binding, OB-fold,Replication factor A protein 3 n=1 Tax=Cinara cedri TaxID=506608 RepID=A0A5E4N218_9HEMI|nr:Nucleic acid-binding, OB-fold,Replication factor A protein 3 [Cinara cedri]
MESVVLPTRAFVNGSYLQKFIDKPVTFIGSVLKVASDSKSITLQSTDDQVVTVHFHEPIDSSLDGWVEVHGYAKSKGTIGGESYYNLPSSITNDFEKQQFNETVALIYSLSNPLK